MTAHAEKPYTATEGWQQHSACKDRPDLWYSTLTPDRRMAAHICLSHCPVFVQCDAQRNTNPRIHSVHAAVLYTGKPEPAERQPNPDAVKCPRCDRDNAAESDTGAPLPLVPVALMVVPASDRKPPTAFDDCGTPKAYKRHLKQNERPDDACREADRRRKARYSSATKKRNTGARTDDDVYQAWVGAITEGVGLGLSDSTIGKRLGISKDTVRRVRIANEIPPAIPAGSFPPPGRKRSAA